MRSALEVRLHLQDADRREASGFPAGESVRLVLVVRNRGDAPESLSLPSARTHDFAVSTADGREVWRWSDGRRFAQMLTELSFAPGEQKSFEVRWERRLRDGAAAPPGRYRAVGWVGPEGRGARSTAVELRLE